MISSVDQEKCRGCGICVNSCPVDILRMNQKGKAYIAYTDDCMTCYLCERVCPAGAIYVFPFREFLPLAVY